MLSFYWQRIVNNIKTTYLLPIGAEHSLEIPLYFTSDSVSKAENVEGLTDHFTGSEYDINNYSDLHSTNYTPKIYNTPWISRGEYTYTHTHTHTRTRTHTYTYTHTHTHTHTYTHTHIHAHTHTHTYTHIHTHTYTHTYTYTYTYIHTLHYCEEDWPPEQASHVILAALIMWSYLAKSQ